MEDGNKGDTEIKKYSQGQIQTFFTKFFWEAENAVSAPYEEIWLYVPMYNTEIVFLSTGKHS